MFPTFFRALAHNLHAPSIFVQRLHPPQNKRKRQMSSGEPQYFPSRWIQTLRVKSPTSSWHSPSTRSPCTRLRRRWTRPQHPRDAFFRCLLVRRPSYRSASHEARTEYWLACRARAVFRRPFPRALLLCRASLVSNCFPCTLSLPPRAVVCSSLPVHFLPTFLISSYHREYCSGAHGFAS